MTITFDPYSREYFSDPYSLYKLLRDEAPVYHNSERKFWALSRFDDVFMAHRERQLFSSAGGVSIEGSEASLPLLIVKDGADHARHKSLVTQVFTPRRMAELESHIRTRARELLDKAAKKSSFDFVTEFAVELPLDVISKLLDIPVEYREEYHHNVNKGLMRGEGHDDNTRAQAQMRVMEIFMTLVGERRKKPRDDVITLLMNTEVKGEDGIKYPLSDFEVAMRFNEMGAAGHETSAKAITNGAMAFTRFPDQKKLLLENSALLGQAVHEVLRFEPPSQLQGRTTTTDVELHGVTIPKGEKVMLLTGAACRDERAFINPDRFDITRSEDPRSIYFGFGVHKCLGMHLAKLEISIAFEELFARYPNFHVDVDRAHYPILSNVRGPSTLPATLN